MNVLDSPLEALAINYVRFGVFAVVNNLWTWVAVVTAALSFWRMRAIAAATIPGSSSSSMTDAQLPLERDAAGSNGCRSTLVVDDKRPVNCPSREMDVPVRCLRTKEASIQHVELVSGDQEAKKGRFTMYYDNAEYDIIDDECGQEAVEICDGVGCRGRLEGRSGWDRVLRMRNVDDMGWYRHQNLAILDGSVVRLWDDYLRE